MIKMIIIMYHIFNSHVYINIIFIQFNIFIIFVLYNNYCIIIIIYFLILR